MIFKGYQTDKLRVLSMWQPWASLAVLPGPHGKPMKVHETRSWSPLVEGAPTYQVLPIQVAIHATRTWNAEIRQACEEFNGYLATVGIHYPRKELPFGAIIGLATITSVTPTEKLGPNFMAFIDSRLGNYAPGRYAWRLENVIAFPTWIPFTGRQSVLYPIDLDTDRAIAEVLEALP